MQGRTDDLDTRLQGQSFHHPDQRRGHDRQRSGQTAQILTNKKHWRQCFFLHEDMFGIIAKYHENAPTCIPVTEDILTSRRKAFEDIVDEDDVNVFNAYRMVRTIARSGVPTKQTTVTNHFIVINGIHRGWTSKGLDSP